MVCWPLVFLSRYYKDPGSRILSPLVKWIFSRHVIMDLDNNQSYKEDDIHVCDSVQLDGT